MILLHLMHAILSQVYIITFKLRKLRYIYFILKFVENPLNYFEIKSIQFLVSGRRRKKKETTTGFLINWTHREGARQSFTFSRAPNCYPFICRPGVGSISLWDTGKWHHRKCMPARLSRSFARLFGYDSGPCKSIQTWYVTSALLLHN